MSFYPAPPQSSSAGGSTTTTLADGSASPDRADPNRPFPKEEIHELARNLSRRQSLGGQREGTNPFGEEAAGTELDPHSENFNARKYAEAALRIRRDDPRNPGRTAGVAFANLSAHGTGSALDFQSDVGNMPLQAFGAIKSLVGLEKNKDQRVDILRNVDGLIRSGEMLVVLGPPGSGCSTFLKTLAGETSGFKVEADSINYQGISAKQMHHDFRGEATYTAEVDAHFPTLTVGDTLTFAARARGPRHPPAGLTHDAFAEHSRDVVMAMLGISHTVNTKVGNDFIRGVSGGERKRTSIAESMLAGSPLQMWDNATRGLDSANAIEFCKSLKLSAELGGSAIGVAIYQAPQSAYDVFDKATVLFAGRQIYFGDAKKARSFFHDMGFYFPEQQSTPDALTSLTSDLERRVRKGFEGKVPQTPDEFAARWKASDEYKALQREIEEYNNQHVIGGEHLERFKESRRAQQAKRQRPTSPYTLSFGQQVKLCTWRGFKRLISDPENTAFSLFGNSAMALIISSVFYNMNSDTGSFTQRGTLLFFAILLSAFASALEILSLYAQRPIVEKHTRYALYHPSAEGLASMLTDMPYKICNNILFSLALYFMTNLRREPGRFFFFMLTTFLMTLAMSAIFRTIGASSRSLSQALAPAAILILALVIYTGFVIPTRNMLGWIRWFNYLDPISYGFEALMVNEFHDRQFPCISFVPSYPDATGDQRACSTVGSVIGQDFVDGDAYINTAYQYFNSNKWRDIGILIAYVVFFTGTYLLATEFISAKKSKGEVLLFQRKQLKKIAREQNDPEAATKPVRTISGAHDVSMIPRQTSIFQWEDVVYDIKIKGEERRILDHVDGWVKPGTLTALMGVSGAGKTTLLDVLATRVTMGVVGGRMLVDGKMRDAGFQRKTGYVQQQDLHLATSTVREALIFSAVLRQPAHVSRQEKLDYVEEVITLLEMDAYADAVVGVPGEGLNVEQRKRLTIGVELAAKPELLLFLDEPTSGLDSQTSWAICDLLTKLTEHGQAILCTIHQPSAMLFQRFDRLLFLAKGGKTIYFGEVGESSNILVDYFVRNGADKCPPGENPAEWMLGVIGAAPGTHTDIDWHKTWLDSPERQEVKAELRRLESAGAEKQPSEKREATNNNNDADDKKVAQREFAAPFMVQFREVLWRVFQQYWRTPSYIYSKLILCAVAGLFVGFSFFNAPLSQQGLQNQLFSIFMILTIFGNLVQQIMPNFCTQRDLYEARERPSKTYSWKVFMLSSMIVEIPWNALGGLMIFFCYYYPVGLYNNAVPTDAVNERAALFMLILQNFLLFTGTFAIMVIAAIPNAETGGNIANLMFSLCLIFCGVLAGPDLLPGFWIFMYRVSPFTYIVEGLIVTGLANTRVTCSDIELVTFQPGTGQTCGAYMQEYISAAGGYLADPNATADCQFCAIESTNDFLALVSTSYSNRWRDYGILWAFIIANVFGALALYWLGRMPKKQKDESDKKKKSE